VRTWAPFCVQDQLAKETLAENRIRVEMRSFVINHLQMNFVKAKYNMAADEFRIE